VEFAKQIRCTGGQLILAISGFRWKFVDDAKVVESNSETGACVQTNMCCNVECFDFGAICMGNLCY
jgi:hypothetical protein